MVRLTGLEPAHLAAPEPKSGVSANFTTGALATTDYYSKSKTKVMSKETKPLETVTDKTALAIQKKSSFPIALVSALSAFILLFCVFALFGYAPFGNRALLYSDADYQYFDLVLYYKRVFAGGDSFFYSFGKSLGGNNFAVFAYYLASPFMLLSLLFKAEDTALCLNVIAAAKMAAAAGTAAYAFSERFGNRKQGRAPYTVLIAVSYGLSQYMLSQTGNVMWLDGAVMLPLVLLGVYLTVKERSGLLLCVSIFLSLVFNWYTGIINCMFSAFWLLFEIALLKGRLIKSCLRYAVYMMSGILLSGILLVPVLLLQAGRTHGSGGLKELLKPGFIGNPADLVSGYAPGMVSIKGSCSLFAGSLVIIGVILFFFCPAFDRWTRSVVAVMLAFTAMTYVFRPLVTVFSIFRNVESYWYRYSYTGIFFLCFIAAAFFMEGDGIKPLFAALSGLMFALLSVLFTLVFKSETQQYIYYDNLASATGFAVFSDMEYALSKVLFPIILSVLIFVILLNKKGLGIKLAAVVIAVFTAADLVLGAGMLLNYYSNDQAAEYSRYVSDESRLTGSVMKGDTNGFYRIVQTSERSCVQNGNTANFNEGMGYGFNSVSSFVSDPEEAQGVFLAKLGYPFHSETITVTASPILPAVSLLGVRYVMSVYDCPGMEKITSEGSFKNAYKNPYCLPSAFITASLPEDTDSLNPFEYQNRVYSALTGEETVLYSNAAYSAARADKKTEFQIAVPEGRYILYGRLLPEEGVTAAADINGAYNLTIGAFLSPDVFVIPMTSGTHNASVTVDTDRKIDPEFYILDLDRFEKCIEKIRAGEASSVNIRRGHADITVSDANGGEKLFISVPYEKSWKVTVNGKAVVPELFCGCMTVVTLENGTNDIVMEYNPPYMITGLAASAAGLLLTVLSAFVYRKKRVNGDAIKNQMKES